MRKLKELFSDESGVEPIVMKLLAGVALLAIGIGIAVGIYHWVGGRAENILENAIENAT